MKWQIIKIQTFNGASTVVNRLDENIDQSLNNVHATFANSFLNFSDVCCGTGTIGLTIAKVKDKKCVDYNLYYLISNNAHELLYWI